MDVDEIQRRARKGPRALFARRAIAVIIGLASTVTIPHLVAPREFGLATMSMVAFGLADMFKDFGLTSALLRKGEIRPDEVTFLFWFNCAMTLLLASLIGAAAPLSAMYFHEPLVVPVMLVALLGFVADGLALQHRSVMGRDLRFEALATIDALLTLVQFAATLGVAAITHDVWAIVTGYVASNMLGALLTVTVSQWKPGPPRWLPEARELFAFGANVSVYGLSAFVSHNIAAVLIGRYFGPRHLGQFNRAIALQIQPQNNLVVPLAHAALPVLARLRPHPDLYRRAYLDLIRNLNIVVWPAAVLVFFAAPPLVILVLGQRWTEAGQLLQALSPLVATPGFGYVGTDLFITQDRSRELRTLGLIEVVFRVLGVIAALPFGVLWVAASYSLTTAVVVAVRVVVASRKGPVTLGDHLGAAAPAVPLALGAFVGCWLGGVAAAQLALAQAPTLAAICLGGGGVSCAIGFASKSSRRAIIQLAATLRGGHVVAAEG